MTNGEIGEALHLAHTNAFNLCEALQEAGGHVGMVLNGCTAMELLETLARNNIIIRAQYLGEQKK